MSTDCLKVRYDKRKTFIMVMGYPLKDLCQNKSLVLEIIKAIGYKMGIDEMKEVDALELIDIESENPDFVVKLNNGKIDIIEEI